MTLKNRWLSLWETLGLPSDPEPLFHEVVACYTDSSRHYHTLQHLEECFNRLDDVRAYAQHPEEIECALWFHDAIYDVKQSGNEEKSAAFAYTSMLENGLDSCAAIRISDLILATRHRAVPEECDAQLLVDIDLSILGAHPLRFDEYERQIREEYSWVEETHFYHARTRLLNVFLARPALFTTPYFKTYYEPQARLNLSHSIQRMALYFNG